eukprot:m.113555 g.113555  ORF g.113555 m.113555 type:complete len:57 (+) comp9267_c0_seq3:1195-1365(+)
MMLIIFREEDLNAWKDIPISSDPFDWMLFEAAQKIFVRKLHEYGIEVPQSLQHITT